VTAACHDFSMAGPARERTGVLVLRAWTDSFTAGGFRARVTSRLDVESTRDEIHTTASVEGVLEIVREWLRDFQDADRTRR
jgi:hypothetical protein